MHIFWLAGMYGNQRDFIPPYWEGHGGTLCRHGQNVGLAGRRPSATLVSNLNIQ